MEQKLVKDLQSLVPKLQGDGGVSNAAEMRQATTLLTQLAKLLHEKSTARAQLGAGALPNILAELLGAQPATESMVDTAAFFELIGQDVYAANGLVEGDNEANAKRLYDAMFPHNCLAFLFNAVPLPKEVWRQYLVGPWAPVVSILLKLTLFEGPMRDELCIPTSIESLTELAFKAYTPGEWGKSETDITRATLVEYMMHTVVNISTAPKFALEPKVVDTLLASFKLWTGSEKSTAPTDLASFSDEQAHTSLGRELSILYHSASILHNFTQAGKIDSKGMMGDEAAVRALVAFLEQPAIPGWVNQSKLTPETKEGMTSILARCKDMATNFVLTLMSNPEVDVPAWLWEKVMGWIKTPSMRMLDVGLAALANSTRNDAKAHSLLAPPSELPSSLVSLLQPSTPVAVQHALVGLIRNLTVYPANRPLLGKPVVDGILSLDPWQPSRDRLDRLQRDAMIALANLSSDPALAVDILANEAAIASLNGLVGRTSLGSVKALASKTLTEIVARLPSSSSESEGEKKAWATAASTPVLMQLGTLAIAVDDTMLLAPALTALLHVAKHGDKDALRVAVMLKMNNGGKTALRIVSGILAPPPLDAPPRNEEIEKTALELVKTLNDSGVTQAVKKAVQENKAAGRPVAAGAEEI